MATCTEGLGVDFSTDKHELHNRSRMPLRCALRNPTYLPRATTQYL